MNLKMISRGFFLIYLFPILLLGIGLRIYNLGTNSVWFDEAIFLLFGSTINGLSELSEIVFTYLRLGQWKMLNPAYTFFASYWGMFAKNEFMARLPSAIFGIISVLLIYYLGKSLFNRKAGLVSAFILAISPFHIYYSQELRMYSLITLLTIISVYFFRKFLEYGRYTFLIGYIIFIVLNIYTQTVTILILFAEIIFFLFYRKRYAVLFRKWLKGHIIIGLSLIPGMLLMALWLKTYTKLTAWEARISTTSELGRISLGIPFFTFKNFCIGYNATPSIYLLAVGIFLILFFLSLFKTDKKEEMNFCLICLFIPMFIMYVFQTFIYADRYLIPSSIFLYLIIGNGLAYIKKTFTIIIMTVISILCFFSLYNYYNNYMPVSLEERIAEHSHKEYKEAVDYILSNSREGDFKIYTDFNSLPSFEYYFVSKTKGINTNNITSKERIFKLIYGVPFFWPVATFSTENNELIAVDLYLKNMYGKSGFKTIPFEEKKRIWLIFSAREFEEANKPGTHERRVVDWFDRNYILSDAKTFQGIILYLYTKT